MNKALNLKLGLLLFGLGIISFLGICNMGNFSSSQENNEQMKEYGDQTKLSLEVDPVESEYVAAIQTFSNDFVYYENFLEAWNYLYNHTGSSASMVLLSDIEVTETLDVNISLGLVLYLNGYQIKHIGESGSVFRVLSNKHLSIKDNYNDNSIFPYVAKEHTIINPLTNEEITINGGLITGGKGTGGSVLGGAILIEENARLVFSSGTLAGNTAINGHGGAIRNNGGTLEMFGGKISYNKAGCGGGVCVCNGDFSFYYGTISNNESTDDGGGVFFESESNHTFSMNYSSTISDNKAKTVGGGVHLYSGNMVFSNGMIQNNIAEASGGGIKISSGTLTFTKGVIQKNSAKMGAGIHYNGGLIKLSNTPKIMLNKSNGVENNLYIEQGYKLEIEEKLNVASSIGVTLSQNDIFTTGFLTYNQEMDLKNIFSSDTKQCIVLDQSEVKIQNHSGGKGTCSTKPVCSLCGEQYGEVDPEHHLFSSTWEKDGENHWRSCSECGVKTENTKHIFNQATHAFKASAATCEKDESYYYSCICGERGTEIFSIPETALGHSYGVWELVEEATCLQVGKRKHTCTRCLKMEEEEIELLPHTFGDWVEEVKASCLEAGKKGHYICEGCQTIFDQNKIILEDLTISALGHNIMSYEGKQATCTESGWASYEACSRCSYTTYQEIPALGHQEVIDLSIAATCITPGSTEGSHCSLCNIVLVQPEVIEPLGHVFGEWEVIHSSTCTAEGNKKQTCSRCNLDREEIIPLDPSAHSFGQWRIIKEATCTEAGEELRTCSHNASHQENRKIESLGHNIIIYEEKQATCTESGWASYEACSRCNYTTYREIPALGHQEVIDLSIAATCTTPGSTEGSHCSICNMVMVQPEVIEPLGHMYGLWNIIQESTIEEFGIERRVCSRNGTHIEQRQLPKRIAELKEFGNELNDKAIVIVSQNNGLLAGTELYVELLEDFSNYEIYKEHIDDEIHSIYDVTLKMNGVSVQPDGMLRLKLYIPASLQNGDFTLYHLHEGISTVIEYTIEEEYAIFEVDRLSEFLFISNSKEDSFSILWLILNLILTIILIGEIGFLIYYKKFYNSKQINSLMIFPFLGMGVNVIIGITFFVLQLVLIIGLGLWIGYCIFQNKKLKN